jgi:hypothetical protein
MPDDVLQAAIAHELARVIQHAVYGHREVEVTCCECRLMRDDNTGFGARVSWFNGVADEMITEWGFDRESMDRRPVVAERGKVIESDDSPRLVTTNSMEDDHAAELG